VNLLAVELGDSASLGVRCSRPNPRRFDPLYFGNALPKRGGELVPDLCSTAEAPSDMGCGMPQEVPPDMPPDMSAGMVPKHGVEVPPDMGGGIAVDLPPDMGSVVA